MNVCEKRINPKIYFTYLAIFLISLAVGLVAFAIYYLNLYSNLVFVAVSAAVLTVLIGLAIFTYSQRNGRPNSFFQEAALNDDRGYLSIGGLVPILALATVLIVATIATNGRVYNGVQATLLGIMFTLVVYMSFKPVNENLVPISYRWGIPLLLTILAIGLIIALTVAFPSNTSALIILTFVIYMFFFFYSKTSLYCIEPHSFQDDLDIIRCYGQK